MALCVSKPEVAREHLLRAAARQFVEGDVQHWWLPESGRGIRTRVSDDRVWLAYVVAHYVEVTGDLGVLDEMVPFLEGPALREGEHEAFFQPTVSDRAGHPVRALRTCPRPEPRTRQSWFAADRHGRLERRHEPGRRARERAKASGSAGFFTPPLRNSPASPTVAIKRSALRIGGDTRPPWEKPSSATAGTAIGIAAPTSMTERRSARPRTANAASIRSRSRGA